MKKRRIVLISIIAFGLTFLIGLRFWIVKGEFDTAEDISKLEIFEEDYETLFVQELKDFEERELEKVYLMRVSSSDTKEFIQLVIDGDYQEAFDMNPNLFKDSDGKIDPYFAKFIGEMGNLILHSKDDELISKFVTSLTDFDHIDLNDTNPSLDQRLKYSEKYMLLISNINESYALAEKVLYLVDENGNSVVNKYTETALFFDLVNVMVNYNNLEVDDKYNPYSNSIINKGLKFNFSGMDNISEFSVITESLLYKKLVALQEPYVALGDKYTQGDRIEGFDAFLMRGYPITMGEIKAETASDEQKRVSGIFEVNITTLREQKQKLEMEYDVKGNLDDSKVLFGHDKSDTNGSHVSQKDSSKEVERIQGQINWARQEQKNLGNSSMSAQFRKIPDCPPETCKDMSPEERAEWNRKRMTSGILTVSSPVALENIRKAHNIYINNRPWTITNDLLTKEDVNKAIDDAGVDDQISLWFYNYLRSGVSLHAFKSRTNVEDIRKILNELKDSGHIILNEDPLDEMLELLSQ